MFDQPDDPEEPATLPLADLLFSVSTVIIVALVALLPVARVGLAGATAADPTTAFADAAQAVTQPGLTLVARPEGVEILDRPARLVGLDQIADDADLARRLGVAAAEGRSIALMVEPDGIEAAFTLEPVIARHAPGPLLQYRRP